MALSQRKKDFQLQVGPGLLMLRRSRMGIGKESSALRDRFRTQQNCLDRLDYSSKFKLARLEA